ncbi:MAG: hypothetical protein FWD69_13590 [Polyangiaceae bacterium]|nr:hypothetical protein [Polyangiaceae bacterium]
MKGRIALVPVLVAAMILACSTKNDHVDGSDGNASMTFALPDGDFTGSSVRICGSRMAPDSKYRCNSSLTPDVEAGTDAGDACPCFNFNADGSLVDSTGAPAVIAGLCPSADFPTANWNFSYAIFSAPDCEGTQLNDGTQNFVCFDSKDIGTRASPNQSVNDVLNPGLNTNHILCPTPQPLVIPQGSCLAASGLSVLVSGTDVIAYVPHNNWQDTGDPYVSVVSIEGTSSISTRIDTGGPVVSCASNSVTGQTVCIDRDNGDVHLINGTTLTDTLYSDATGHPLTFGAWYDAACTTCAVTMDPIHNRALISMSLNGFRVYDFLDLDTHTFLTPFLPPARASAIEDISAGPLVDPIRRRILSPNPSSYDIYDVTDPSNPQSFYRQISENINVNYSFFTAAGEDCSTGFVLASSAYGYYRPPVTPITTTYIANLTQATFTPGAPGAPAGTWNAPDQILSIDPEGITPSNGLSTVAIAQGRTHQGILTDIDGGLVTAIQLPAKLGTGAPALVDWVSCNIDPPFKISVFPQPVTAYTSPNTGHAMAVLFSGPAGNPANQLAVIDLTEMLDPVIVPRTSLGHACEDGTLPSAVWHTVSVP